MFGSRCIKKTGIHFVSYCKKKTRERDEHNEYIKTILEKPLDMSRKYYNKSFGWIIKNDKTIYCFYCRKGYLINQNAKL